MDYNVRIIFMSQGADAAAKGVDKIGDSADKSSKKVSGLQRYIAGFFAVQAIESTVKNILGLGDSYTILQNRIAASTSSQAEAQKAMSDVTGIAQTTRTSLDEAGNAYTRLTLATQDLGTSQAEVAALTTTLLESFTAISGSSSGAAATVNQLATAFESGSLQGRQFRSIINQNPLIVNELSKAIGLSVSQLRTLGAEGQLSSQLLLSAFQQAGPALSNAFGKTQATIEQQVSRLKATFTELAGTPLFPSGKSASGAVADFIGTINDAFRTGSGKFTAEQQAFMDREKQLLVAAKARKAFINDPLPEGDAQKEYINKLGERLTLENQIAGVELTRGQVEGAAQKVLNSLSKEKLVGETEYNKMLASGQTQLQLNQKSLVKIADSEVSALVARAKSVETLKLAKAVQDELGLSTENDNTKIKIANDLIERRPELLARVLEYTNKIKLAELQKSPTAADATQAGLLKIGLQNNDNRGISDEMVRVYNNINGAARTYEQTLSAINSLESSGLINHAKALDEVEKAQIAVLDSQKDMVSGFERGFLKVDQEIHDFASQSEKVVTNAFHNMEDAVVEFTHTGKLNFSNMVNGILDDLTRLLFRQALSGALSSFGGGGFGSIFGSIAGAVGGGGGVGAGGGEQAAMMASYGGGRAGGGPVDSGRPYTVGENGPEIFKPSSAGSIIPNGSGGMGGVHVTVVNVSDPEDAARAFTDPTTDAAFLNKVTRNRSDLKRLLS